MIGRVRVDQYQSLGQVDLVLGRITVVTGHSDSGKSAILRAIEDAVFGGTDADVVTVRGGVRAKEAVVQLELEDGLTVRWVRSKTSHYEMLRDGQVQTWRRMARTVPDEIVTFLGIREVQVDSGTGPTAWARLQFVGQFDQPFMLVDRGGVASARLLGRLTGVHIFADAVKRAKSDGHAIDLQIDNLDQQVEAAQAEADALEGVEQEVERLEAMQLDVAKTRQLLGQADQIDMVVRLTDAANDRLAQIGFDVGQAETFLESLRPALQTAWVSVGSADRIEAVLDRIEQAEVRRDAIVVVAEWQLPDLQLADTLRQQLDKLEWAVGRVDQAEQTLMAKQQRFDQAVAEAAELKGLLEAVDQAIPLCPFRLEDAPSGLYRCRDVMRAIGSRGQDDEKGRKG